MGEGLRDQGAVAFRSTCCVGVAVHPRQAPRVGAWWLRVPEAEVQGHRERHQLWARDLRQWHVDAEANALQGALLGQPGRLLLAVGQAHVGLSWPRGSRGNEFTCWTSAWAGDEVAGGQCCARGVSEAFNVVLRSLCREDCMATTLRTPTATSSMKHRHGAGSLTRPARTWVFR